MRLRTRLAAAAATVALATGAVVATAPTAGASTPTAGQQIINALINPDLAKFEGNPYDWDIVTAIVAGNPTLASTLAAQNNVTVFAPNDRAFEVLAKRLGLVPSSYTFGATVDEAYILGRLGQLPKSAVESVVLYHVFAQGAVTESAAKRLPVWGTSLPMANGQNLGVINLSRFTGVTSVFLIDRDGSTWNDRVIDRRGDLIVAKDSTGKVTGVVHGITDVLLPKL